MAQESFDIDFGSSSPFTWSPLSPPTLLSDAPGLTTPIKPARKKQKVSEMENTPAAQPSVGETPKEVELVPGADVTLRVGQGEKALTIWVSGAALSLASEVFGIMLHSCFVDGLTKVIELKEDDPKIVLHFCRIIHYQKGLFTAVERDQLVQLTQFADLRCCEEALKPWIMLALDDYRAWSKAVASAPADKHTFPSSIPGLLEQDLVSIAYAFDIPDLFTETTIALIARSSKIRSRVADNVENDFFPIRSCSGSFFGRLFLLDILLGCSR